MSQGEWASWAQAAFSMVAILVAVVLAFYQVNKQHSQQRAADIAAARVFAASWTIFIGMGAKKTLEIKDACTKSIQQHKPLDASFVRARLDEIVLPSETQMLRLSAALPQAAVALANATLHVSMLKRTLESVAPHPQEASIHPTDIAVLMVRQWSKLAHVNLRKATDEMRPLMLDKTRLRWIRRLHYKMNPEAQEAAFVQGGIEGGWLDSIPLEAGLSADERSGVKVEA